VICEPVFVNNEMVGVKGSMQDIHRKKILEAEVLEKNKMVNRLVDLSTDIIAVIDKSGNGKLISDSAATLLGSDADELHELSLFNIVYEDDKETTANILQLINKLKIVSNYENRIVKKDGTLVNMSWSYIWDEDSESIYSIGRDITENKRMEEDLRLSENKFKSIVR
jgi:PAS domain S-box-containing protein